MTTPAEHTREIRSMEDRTNRILYESEPILSSRHSCRMNIKAPNARGSLNQPATAVHENKRCNSRGDGNELFLFSLRSPNITKIGAALHTSASPMVQMITIRK